MAKFGRFSNTVRTIFLFGILGLLSAVGPGGLAHAQTSQTLITGFVYYDLNANGQWDPGEPKAPGSQVAWAVGGTQVAGTSSPIADAQGNFTLDVTQYPTTADHPYVLVSHGHNAVDDVLPMPIGVGAGQSVIFVAPGQTGTINLGVQFPQLSDTCLASCVFGGTPREWGFNDYEASRGSASTLGDAISHVFLLQGFPTQIFQRAVLQRWPDGSIHLLNLLDPGLMPFTIFNGTSVPAYDATFVARAPAPGAPDYGNQIVQYVATNAPDEFAGQLVNFHLTFLHTVTQAEASWASPVDPRLLPGFDLEIWGIPTSAPKVDPRNSQFIYQRFQRGIMHYQGNLGVTSGLLLGEYFKAILTRQSLPPDVAQEAASSPYLDQYCTNGAHWICRPSDLDPTTTDLTGAFEP